MYAPQTYSPRTSWYTQMVTRVKDKNIFDTPIRNANKRMPGGMAVRILLIKWPGFIFINITNTHTTRVEVSSTSSHRYWELASSLTWYNPNLTRVKAWLPAIPTSPLTFFSLFCRLRWLGKLSETKSKHLTIFIILTLLLQRINQNNMYTPTKWGTLRPNKNKFIILN